MVRSFCIVPGCSNAYYRVKVSGKVVHFHQLPMTKPEVLRRWLAALKRKDPPVGPGRRVCSDHFIPSNYRITNRLKPDAVPSVFDFSGYSSGIVEGQVLSNCVQDGVHMSHDLAAILD
uniref:THAP-type domain-containing protein n=1 Tax=Echeneis naucrates TaxID=173247 RepID=A0A665VU30_ECHNA